MRKERNDLLDYLAWRFSAFDDEASFPSAADTRKFLSRLDDGILEALRQWKKDDGTAVLLLNKNGSRTLK